MPELSAPPGFSFQLNQLVWFSITQSSELWSFAVKRTESTGGAASGVGLALLALALPALL